MLLIRVLTSKFCQNCGINHRPGTRLNLELLENYSIATSTFCKENASRISNPDQAFVVVFTQGMLEASEHLTWFD